jgi:hypothetical protein
MFLLLWKGNMDRKRLLELAVEALEKQKAEAEATIAEIHALQRGTKRIAAKKPGMQMLVVVKRRSKTAAQRKALSRRMKEIWAAKRLRAAKPPITAKRRPKSAAEKKALSLKMKRVWAAKKKAAKKIQ